ncbi:MAG: hypothetical protein ACQERZ_04725 [Fusobacteriota bacterium]
MRNKIFILIYLFCSTLSISQIEIGGDLKVNSTGKLMKNNNQFIMRESAEIELFLPIKGDSEGNLQLELPSDDNFFIKKMYLENHFPKYDISMGRQPVSWGFGSLLNPIDYTLGAESMEEETSSKNIDAFKFYYPIGWSDSITLVVSDENYKPKLGIRGRKLIKGYDITGNIITNTNSEETRFGFSGKGDLKNIGVYGSYGYNLDKSDYNLVLGMDYSFMVSDLNKLSIQGEYLKDNTGFFQGILSEYVGEAKKVGEDVIAGILSYNIDDFSNVRILSITDISEDISSIMGLEYSNQIGSALDIKLGSFFFLSQDKLWGIPDDQAANGNIFSEVKYSF